MLIAIKEHLPFIRGSAQLVGVVATKRGQKQTEILFYYDRVRALQWDPNRLFWSDHNPFMDYSTQKGRALLRRTHPPPQVAERKWNCTLPADFDFRWAEIWDSRRIRKEAELSWRISHQALAVNHWRGKIFPAIDTSCPVCSDPEEETI